MAWLSVVLVVRAVAEQDLQEEWQKLELERRQLVLLLAGHCLVPAHIWQPGNCTCSPSPPHQPASYVAELRSQVRPAVYTVQNKSL